MPGGKSSSTVDPEEEVMIISPDRKMPGKKSSSTAAPENDISKIPPDNRIQAITSSWTTDSEEEVVIISPSSDTPGKENNSATTAEAKILAGPSHGSSPLKRKTDERRFDEDSKRYKEPGPSHGSPPSRRKTDDSTSDDEYKPSRKPGPSHGSTPSRRMTDDDMSDEDYKRFLKRYRSEKERHERSRKRYETAAAPELEVLPGPSHGSPPSKRKAYDGMSDEDYKRLKKRYWYEREHRKKSYRTAADPELDIMPGPSHGSTPSRRKTDDDISDEDYRRFLKRYRSEKERHERSRKRYETAAAPELEVLPGPSHGSPPSKRKDEGTSYKDYKLSKNDVKELFNIHFKRYRFDDAHQDRPSKKFKTVAGPELEILPGPSHESPPSKRKTAEGISSEDNKRSKKPTPSHGRTPVKRKQEEKPNKAAKGTKNPGPSHGKTPVKRKQEEKPNKAAKGAKNPGPSHGRTPVKRKQEEKPNKAAKGTKNAAGHKKDLDRKANKEKLSSNALKAKKVNGKGKQSSNASVNTKMGEKNKNAAKKKTGKKNIINGKNKETEHIVFTSKKEWETAINCKVTVFSYKMHDMTALRDKMNRKRRREIRKAKNPKKSSQKINVPDLGIREYSAFGEGIHKLKEIYGPTLIEKLYNIVPQRQDLPLDDASWHEKFTNAVLGTDTIRGPITTWLSNIQIMLRDVSEMGKIKRRSGCLLVAPTSSGKTSLVYNLAKEGGYNVAKFDASSKIADLEVLVKSYEEETGSENAFIFVEDVDIVLRSDECCLSALKNLISSTTKPIMMTSSDIECPFLDRLRLPSILNSRVTNQHTFNYYSASCALIELINLMESPLCINSFMTEKYFNLRLSFDDLQRLGSSLKWGVPRDPPPKSDVRWALLVSQLQEEKDQELTNTLCDSEII